MTDDQFFAEEAADGDQVAALRRMLVRSYNLAMAKMRPDEARKAINQLARLLPPAQAEPGEPSEAEIELRAVRAHLRHVAPEGTAPSELARIASEMLLELPTTKPIR